MSNLSNELVPTERLQKISSWREKYGNDHNVMIPAKEAELIVSELLAYREAQGNPVAWISERNLKNLGKQFSVYVKHEPAMVRTVPLFTTPQLRVVADDEQADREFNSLDTL